MKADRQQQWTHRERAGARRRATVAFVLCIALWQSSEVAWANGGVTSRTDAVAIMLDVVSPPTLRSLVTAFLTREPLTAGDLLHPFGQSDRAIPITGPTWFGWIDDRPQQLYSHDTRFVLIDVGTGTVTVLVEEWWPVLNGASRFISDPERTDPELVVFSSVHRKEPEDKK